MFLFLILNLFIIYAHNIHRFNGAFTIVIKYDLFIIFSSLIQNTQCNNYSLCSEVCTFYAFHFSIFIVKFFLFYNFTFFIFSLSYSLHFSLPYPSFFLLFSSFSFYLSLLSARMRAAFNFSFFFFLNFLNLLKLLPKASWLTVYVNFKNRRIACTRQNIHRERQTVIRSLLNHCSFLHIAQEKRCKK